MCSFELYNTGSPAVIDSGEFSILIDDYIDEAPLYKYCIVCGALKPLTAFGKHAARKNTRRQGECRECKNTYNATKNQTRTTDQHREAAFKRRLYVDLGPTPKIDVGRISEKFSHKCFKCKIELDATNSNLDHTLPVYYLWHLETETATLLCKKHNSQKSNAWPAKFYSDTELRALSTLTGIEYRILSGEPYFNPEALELLKQPEKVTAMFEKYAAYPAEVENLRNRILTAAGFDIFTSVPELSTHWAERADRRLHLPNGTDQPTGKL
ncbi:hypothetical protein ACTXK2_15925 [Arthrobacter rhombi]